MWHPLCAEEAYILVSCLASLQPLPNFHSRKYISMEIEQREPRIVYVQPKPMLSIISCRNATNTPERTQRTRLNEACAVAGASWLMSTRIVLLILLLLARDVADAQEQTRRVSYVETSLDRPSDHKKNHQWGCKMLFPVSSRGSCR